MAMDAPEDMHPRDYKINRESSDRCYAEVAQPRFDVWNERERDMVCPAAEIAWLWEEQAQLLSVIKMQQSQLAQLRGCAQSEPVPEPGFVVADDSSVPAIWSQIITVEEGQFLTSFDVRVRGETRHVDAVLASSARPRETLWSASLDVLALTNGEDCWFCMPWDQDDPLPPGRYILSARGDHGKIEQARATAVEL